eukprot:c8278_g1_i1 orf=270-1214(+)
MASAWSAVLNPTQIYRQHGNAGRDVQAFSVVHEHKIQYGIRKLRQRGIRLKQKGRIILHASVGETIEDKGTESSKEEEASEKGDQANVAKSPSVSSTSPFVGAKISSRIAARVADTTNGRTTASTTIPITPTSSKTPSSQGIPTFNPKTLNPQENPTFRPKPPSSQTFSPKPPSSQAFSPKPPSSQGSPFGSKPPSSQGSPFGSPQAGAEKLKGAKPSVFLDSRAGGFKEPGPKNLLDTLRQSDGSRSTKYGQPIVPTNLFDEPDKLTPEERKFEFSFSAGQLVLIFSFLTIISIMLGTSFLVWKVGGIHYNEF